MPMPPASLTPVVLLAAIVAGCHEKSNPVAPNPAVSQAAIASLTIGGVEAVLTGTSANYLATATMSDSTLRVVTPAWTSSNTDVAAVDTAGRVDGRAHGQPTLIATIDGTSGAKTVQVI